MTTSAVITIDLVNNTATNVYTFLGNILNSISFANNQITYNPRSAASLIPNDLGKMIAQLQIFQNALLLNFPTLNNIQNQSIGTTHCSIKRTDSTTCIYNSTGTSTDNVENFTYDYAILQCAVTARTIPVTVSYSSWLLNLASMQRYLLELYR
jgi:hypothetical protein